MSAAGLGQRLSWWLAWQALLGLSLVCASVYLVTALTLAQRQEEMLDQKQAVLQHLLAEGRASHAAAGIRHQLDDFHAGHSDLRLRLLAPDGRVLYLGSREASSLPRWKSRVFEIGSPELGLPGGADWARAELSLDVRADDVLLNRLAKTLVAAALAGTLLIALGGFRLVRLGLRPLHLLVEQTRALDARQMAARLDGSAQPAELQPLIAQFNDLLDRLACSYRQMEGFNADVAHELNTPLANLISSCELALRRRRDAEELREVLGSNLEELRRMAGMVGDMLFLAHADRGHGARRQALPSLARLAREVIEFHEAALEEAGLSAEVLGEAGGLFDGGLLRRALSNLLGNARRFARPGSTVQVCIQLDAQGLLRLSVVNQGASLDPADLPRWFDRFYRADSARGQGERNHGLGLSIVAAVARLHGGEGFAQTAQGRTEVGFSLRTDPAVQA
ncbi:two-component system heavy metal sensor histidine kinase CusS [Paucibacter oligotrophus]|uniref:Sensor protein n=1 Tax=Roseateles oligotrophus TaxID=1769250 RepID=A0A840LAY0_9BURK|nr:heavy metal sensor histidine kinase [Roseateles oligotrophus]MBB4843802.1 two-component system heavy metal sensor histidine kinase CusS [Roseateles oligotrophus]